MRAVFVTAALLPSAHPAGAVAPACDVTGQLNPQCTLRPADETNPSAFANSQWFPAEALAAATGTPYGLSAGRDRFEHRAHRTPLPEVGLSLGSADPLGSLSSSAFKEAETGESWATSESGEWAVAARIPAGEIRFSSGPSCALHSLAVLQPTAGSLALRLGFVGGCGGGPSVASAGSGEEAAAVLLPLRRVRGRGGRLIDWMCAAMPRQVCWPPLPTTTSTIPPPPPTTTRAGNIEVQMDADYSAVGDGLCHGYAGVAGFGGAMEEMRSAARTVADCAVECLSGNTYALRNSGGARCDGFAFSGTHSGRCRVYRQPAEGVPSSTAPDRSRSAQPAAGWTCFTLRRQRGGSLDTPPSDLAPRMDAGYSAAPPARSSSIAASAVVEAAAADAAVSAAVPAHPEAFLNIREELSAGCFAAVRQYITPLIPKCFPPLTWLIPLQLPAGTSEHAGDGSSGGTVHENVGGLGRLPRFAVIDVNETTWEFLSQKLPLAGPRDDRADAAVASDVVCVEVGTSGCCARALSEAWRVPALPPLENWWRYATVAAASSALTLASVTAHRQLCGSRYTYTLVENDAWDPAGSKIVDVASAEGRPWGRGGYIPFPLT